MDTPAAIQPWANSIGSALAIRGVDLEDDRHVVVILSGEPAGLRRDDREGLFGLRPLDKAAPKLTGAGVKA